MDVFFSKNVENSSKLLTFHLSTVFTVENVEYFQLFFTFCNRLAEINFTVYEQKYQPRRQKSHADRAVLFCNIEIRNEAALLHPIPE